MTNIRWDWRTWIEEGLLDCVTIKNTDMTANVFDQVVETARAHGVETIYSPYMNCFFSASQTWARQVADILDDVVKAGLAGLTFYETAAFLRAKQSGDVVEHFPELKNILRPYT